ncbi:hypothetical protein B0H13DRAFT_1851101 [Mycena leptocephala]|nr:hypothetical protein B0H13DRAFT_1851101 [Mycena leptocephala]
MVAAGGTGGQTEGKRGGGLGRDVPSTCVNIHQVMKQIDRAHGPLISLDADYRWALEENCSTEWTIARVANSTRKERSHRLVRLIQPLPRLLIPAVPAAPAAGAPPNLPAPFVPPPIVAPGHHPLFPATKRGLERLNTHSSAAVINLATLLAAYNQPVPATKPLRQAAPAQFIGLPL